MALAARRAILWTVMGCLVPVCHSDAQAGALPDSSSPARVDVLLAPFDRTDAPGVSVAVYRAGEILYDRAVGMADLEHHVRLTPSSVFDIASMSKQFTAMAIVLLHLSGQLSLDDDTRRFLPEVHTAGRRITVRQLLQHTSGIRDYLDLMDLAGEDPANRAVSQADVLDVTSTQRRLNFDPGTAFRYENSSYALMATLVQRVSGKSLRQFAQERIFAPLQMRSTRFQDNHTELIENRAYGYESGDSGWSVVTPTYDEVGDGGVWTTVEDLAKWDANFFDKPTVGGDSGVRLLQSQAILHNGRKMSYALGLFVGTYRGFTTVSHGGVDPGYRAQMLRFPSQRLTVAVLANNSQYDVEQLARQIADVYLPNDGDTAIAPSLTHTAGPDWTRFVGRYLDETTGREREIVRANDRLVLRSGGKDFPLVHLTGDRFEDPSDGGLVRFATSRDGNARMTKSTDGQMPWTARRLPAHAPQWGAAEYTGTYTASELGVTWRLESAGSDLVLVRPHAAGFMLRRPYSQDIVHALDKDEFAADPGLIRFFRNDHNRVIGFTVTNVRDVGIAFVRH
jgi:CubicO group peptidase (beta-lactamase class C family)